MIRQPWLIAGFLVSVGLAIPGENAQARDCSSKDYRSQLPPVRDQGVTGWCVPFAFTDMIAQFYGISPKDPLSAGDVVRETDNYLGRAHGTDLQGVSSDQFSGLSKYFSQQGICHEHAFRTAGLHNYLDSADSIKEIIMAPPVDKQGHELPKKDWPVCPPPYYGPNDGDLHALFPAADIPSLKKILAEVKKKSGKANPDNFPAIDTMRNQACQGDIFKPAKPPDLVCKDGNMDYFAHNHMDYMDQALDSGHVAMISYRPGFATDPDFLRRYYDLGKPQGATADQIAHHTTLVVGRKAVGGHCYYEVRETIGKICEGFSKQVECDKSDPGNYWVRGDLLESNTDQVYWLQ